MIKTTFEGFERGYPLIILFSLFLSYFMTHKIDFFIFAVLMGLSSVFNQFLKEFIFKPIMKNKKFPILGEGTRPSGAKDCSDFIDPDNRLSSSYGMPSGHAQTSALFCTFMILMIINERYSKKLKMVKCLFILLLTIAIMVSRIHFGCHTPQQVIVGGLIGTILGFIFFFNMKKIKSLLKLN